MVRSRRSISKEDISSVLTDSGISLSSPPAVIKKKRTKKATGNEQKNKICVASDESIDRSNEKSENGSNILSKNVRINSNKGQLSARNRKAHVCSVCKKEFGGKTDLKRHMLIHSDERPHVCSKCGKSYRQAVNLKNHITTAHDNRKEFCCQKCPKSFALKERLRLHMRLHSGEKPYACALCDKRFARGGQLQQHVVSHHKTSLQQFNCTKCTASFSTNGNLRVHMERHDQCPEHHCGYCNSTFANEVAKRAHINQMHYKLNMFECEICSKTIDNADFTAHMHKHSKDKVHVCEVCNTFFNQKSQYNVHMRMHTGERPYQCRICHQTFAHSSVLKLHIRKHTGEKPFRCLICQEEVAFSQLAHLKTHMKKIHHQQKPYMCVACNEFFKVKIELQAHSKLCTKKGLSGEEPIVQNDNIQALSNMRFNMAVVLKKISTEEKLRQLGYEKRLIDNVIIASLKLANRKAFDDPKLSPIERLRLNVQEFLNWIVPVKSLVEFQEQRLSVDSILEKIAAMYIKQK